MNAKPPTETDETATGIETETTTQPAPVEEKTAEIQIDHEMIVIATATATATADGTTVIVTMRETTTEKETVIATESPRVLVIGIENTTAETTTKADRHSHVLPQHMAMALDDHQEETMDMEIEAATDFQGVETDTEDAVVIEDIRSINYKNIINISVDTKVTTKNETTTAMKSGMQRMLFLQA